MSKGLLASLATWFAGAGLLLGHAPAARAQEIDAPVVAGGPNEADAGDNSRVWASGEYLLWWFKHSPEPVPLVATAPLGPGSLILLGGQNVHTDEHSGGRFTLGLWLDCDQTLGVDAGYFFLGQRTTTIPGLFPPDSLTARVPWTAPSGVHVAPLILTGPRAGGTVVSGEELRVSQSLQGWETNGLLNVMRGNGYQLDLLLGGNYLDLQEGVAFATAVAGAGRLAGLAVNTLDQFSARNQFYGGQLGGQGEARLGNLFVNAKATVALGDVHENVGIGGATAIAGAPAGVLTNGVFPGSGIFALPTNGGVHKTDRFAVVPEATVKVGYQVASWARAYVGYSFLYLSDAQRPGDQISGTINGGQIPSFALHPGLAGTAAPLYPDKHSDFWAQGLDFGLEFRY
ncbi:MAG: BBP7 family outer membrane beta-barrel protein [Planctomycetes bacterium]|nr:BBP7 family outer membrane beta-barrel protein [Planctomycetota bacterium]